MDYCNPKELKTRKAQWDRAVNYRLWDLARDNEVSGFIQRARNEERIRQLLLKAKRRK